MPVPGRRGRRLRILRGKGQRRISGRADGHTARAKEEGVTVNTMATEHEEVSKMKKWLERLTEEQKAKFAELGEHISLITLAKFCEDEGLELPDVSVDVEEIKK